jgi:hypothetical protein
VQAGGEPAQLIVLRSNSGAGQSSVAAEILDVPFEETMRRHATRPQAAEFGRAEVLSWYRERDLRPARIGRIIPSTSSLNATARLIMSDAGWAVRGDQARD